MIDLWLQRRVAGMGLDESGIAVLKRDEDTAILLEVLPDSDVCHFYAPVAPLPQDVPEAALLAALSLNRFGRPLGGCWLAWDDEIQMLVLCWNMNVLRRDEIDFNNAVDNFIAALDAARFTFMPQPVSEELQLHRDLA